MRGTRTTLAVTALAALAAPRAMAEESRFAVVDVTPSLDHEAIVTSVEREVQRLRPGARPLDETAMRRLLATGEGPAAAAVRLMREAQQHRLDGDCAGAIERADASEGLTLSVVPLDDERDLLRSIYVTLVICGNELGRAPVRDAAARRLRDLVSLPPPGLPQELWDKFVANATPPQPTTELLVDTEPANAQIAIDFHGVGVTPRTLKVPKGVVYVEVQKDGYLKGFRKVTVGNQPTRTVFRLIERTHDRLDQALGTLSGLRNTDPTQRPQPLSRLAQLSRADMLVLLQVAGDRVRIWFFDAERGAISKDVITSPYDAATGRVTALAERTTPAGAPPPRTPVPTEQPPTTATPEKKPTAGPPMPKAPAPATTGLGEAQAQATNYEMIRKRRRPPTPWWSWALAGLLGASLLTYVFYIDRPQHQDTLAVRAYWNPPPPPPTR